MTAAGRETRGEDPPNVLYNHIVTVSNVQGNTGDKLTRHVSQVLSHNDEQLE